MCVFGRATGVAGVALFADILIVGEAGWWGQVNGASGAGKKGKVSCSEIAFNTKHTKRQDLHAYRKSLN